MWTDPLVEDVRREREEHAAQFKYDLDAIVREFQKQEKDLEKQGWQVVTLTPKRLPSSGKAA